MKKLLCLVLSVVMTLSCFGICMTASAADYLYRPEEVARVIDPILTGMDSVFAKGIYDMGYKTAESQITASEFEKRIKGYTTSNIFPADDKMFGVSLDFLYNRDSSAFTWDFCKFELTANANIHNEEIKQAEADKKKSTCQMKGWYDTCGEILNGYEYDYPSKSIDLQIYEGIIEMKSTIFNNSTRRNEAHYKYYYFFDESQFSLMRSNSNYLIKKVVDGSIGNGKLYATKEIANANAIKLSNFIGNLLYPEFDNIPADSVIIDNNVSMTDKEFFRVVTEQSRLDDILQAYWVKANTYDVRDIMTALGVSTKDEVILDVELTKGTYMGARILTDIYKSFVDSPVGYIARLFQLFARNYDGLYKQAIQDLFTYKFETVSDRSKTPGDSVDSYDGFELTTFDGFINFIADSIYFNKIDSGVSATNFTFAPLPIVRLANAKDIDELYLYLLCYFDINRSYAAPRKDAIGNVIAYDSNSASISNFITKTEQFLKANHTSETKDTDISSVKTVMEDIFTSALTFPEIRAFYLGIVVGDVITSFPDNFMSSIKNAIANLINNFIRAMDNFMNLLFGWTDGLFDKNK